MQGWNHQGIREFVQKTVQSRSSHLKYDNDLADLVNNAVDKVERVFLWARFAMLEILEGIDRGETHEALSTKLSGLAPDLTALYGRIFHKLVHDDREELLLIFHLVFSWYATTSQDLSLAMLLVALKTSKKK